ncbi:ribosomal protein S21 family protein [Artemisia annua]|uniref:Ribosomal protein S21 family protein n=1 Tax=Artemisia annua TaxID=35608 RepID=A0A2U1N1U4_ARTAN|nr:ribosomal protein S21 family protein [Artemisia annua]
MNTFKSIFTHPNTNLTSNSQQWRSIRVKILNNNLERGLTYMQRIMQSSGIERMIKNEQIYHVKNSEKRVLARKNMERRLKSQDLARKLKSILVRKVSVKRNVMALTEAMEREVDRREDADTRMLLLASEEFDKVTGGYKSESEEAEEENSEEEPSPKETASKKTKASTKLQCSKKKKHRSEVLNGAENECVTDEIDKVHLEPKVSNAENREVSKDPSPVAANKEDNAWTVITTGGWNKWANNGFVVHGKGSALGPALKWLRSAKPDWLKEKT